MTAKTDEGSAANAAADSIASADRESAPAGGLPSIIVDPSIASAAVAATTDEAPAPPANGSADAAPHQATSAPPAPEVANGSASDRFSVEDADRFAASFRPSWEPPAPVAVVPAAPQPAADFGMRGEEIARVPRSRKSGILLTLGAVSGFLALGALALMSSRHTPPPSWDSAPTQAAPEEPAAALPQQVPPAPAAQQPAEPAVPATPPAVEQPAVAEATPLAPADPTAAPLAAAEPVADLAAVVTPAIAAPAIASPTVEAASAPASPPQVMPAAPAEPPAQPVQPVQPIAQPAQAEPPPVAAPKLVKVRISATPSEAELSLDGQSIPNPFEAELLLSGKHRVQAKASGHRSADVTVPFDQPQELALRLERLEPAKPRPRRSRSAPTPRKTAPVNRGAGFVSESPY